MGGKYLCRRRLSMGRARKDQLPNGRKTGSFNPGLAHIGYFDSSSCWYSLSNSGQLGMLGTMLYTSNDAAMISYWSIAGFVQLKS